MHEARPSGHDGPLDHRFGLFRRRGVISFAAERLDHCFVMRLVGQCQRGRIAVRAEVFEIASVYAAVVEHHECDRQPVAACRLDLHAVESERGIAADVQHFPTGGHRRANRIAGSASHDAPCAAVETATRFAHRDDVAAVVERVGAFVGEDEILMVPVVDLRDGAERVEMAHRHLFGTFLRREFRFVRCARLANQTKPFLGCRERTLFQCAVEHHHGGADVAHHRHVDLARVVDLLRVDVDLDEPHLAVPWFALAERQHPVEARADEQHHIGVAQRKRTAAGGAARIIVRHHAFGHRHGLERDVGFADEFADFLFGAGDRRALADDHQRMLGLAQQRHGRIDRRA